MQFKHNGLMKKDANNPKTRPRLLIPAETLDDAPPRVPARRMLGSTGVSIAIHAFVFLILSAIVIAQKDTAVPLVSELRLTEDEGNSDELIELDSLELPVVEAPQLNVSGMTSMIEQASVRSDEMSLNLSSFSSVASGDSSQGLPSGIAAIAGGIQGRVAKAGGRTGEVQFSLAWRSFNDVDLHVIAPSGEHISYGHRTSQCEGELDVDMNAGTRAGAGDKSFSDEPVENVRWLPRKAPSGRFTVLVHQFRWRSGQPEDKFQLLVNLGDKTEVIEGTVTSQESLAIYRFRYARGSLSKGRQNQLLTQMTQLQEREEAKASELLDKASLMDTSVQRDQEMRAIIRDFPHTDAAIRAMQHLEGKDKN